MSVIVVSYQLHKNPFSLYEHSNPDSESVYVGERWVWPSRNTIFMFFVSPRPLSQTHKHLTFSLSLCISS